MEESDDKLHKYFEDWVAVIENVDRGLSVLVSRIPLKDDFFEPNLRDINYSLLRYLDSLKPEAAEEGKAFTDLEKYTTFHDKFAANKYSSLYEIFHDLKVSCIIRLLQVEDDPVAYKNVDKFFKIATELLLRECLRIGMVLEVEKKNSGKNEREESSVDTDEKDVKMDDSKNEESTDGLANTAESNENINHKEEKEKKENEQKELEPCEQGIDMETSLEQTLATDFDMITRTFVDKTSETLSMVASGNLPLFTSLNRAKSELDDREPIVDATLGVNIVKVIPNLCSVKPEKMIFLSQSSPQPLPAVGRILDSYMHPNWLWLTASQWLKHGDKDINYSFAPSYDESKSTITNKWKGLTWMQQVGFEEMRDLKLKYNELLGEQSERIVDGSKPEDDGSKVLPNDVDEKQDEKKDDSKDLEEGSLMDDEKIDLKNLLKWNIGNTIDDAEKNVIKDNKVQKQISNLLLELNELRKSRITFQRQQLAAEQQFYAQQSRQGVNTFGAGYHMIRASKQEVEKYHKLKRLISGLLKTKNINPSKLNLQLSKKLLVLQHNYGGTLPVSLSSSGHYGRYGNSRSSKRRR